MVALRFRDGGVRHFCVPSEHVVRAEQLLGIALARATGDYGRGGDSVGRSIVEVFIPPGADDGSPKTDAWWGNEFVHPSTASYRHYRDTIDALIVSAVRDVTRTMVRAGGSKKGVRKGRVGISTDECRATAAAGGGGGGCDGCGGGGGALADDASGSSSGQSFRIGELCAGDGSLASKVIRDILQQGIVALDSYVMYERNVDLAAKAFTATEEHFLLDGGAGAGAHSQCKCIATSVVLDVSSVKGLEAVAALTPSVDLWIASGSVLCGQVGSFGAAQPTLDAMAASLSPGGVIIITGFTQSFLHPRMIQACGLEVVRASVPSGEAGGLESGFGRFHMFVLRKKGRAIASSGERKGGEKSGIVTRSDALRQLMIGVGE
jgi:hypothetical protein